MNNASLEGFTFFFGITEGIGLVFVVLVATWLGTYRGGFAWTSQLSLEFNWHPLLLSIALIFLYANSILVYRAFRNNRKRKLKLAHAVMHGVAFILTVIGLQAVFDSHNLSSPPIPNMYSLHSWIGLTSVIMFACQWVAGFITFLFPMLNTPLRSTYLPIHVFFGLVGFVLAAAAALLGLSEKAFFTLSKVPTRYQDLPSEGLLINMIGVVLVLFTTLVVYITTETRYKRHPLPEDEVLLVGGTAAYSGHSTTAQGQPNIKKHSKRK